MRNTVKITKIQLIEMLRNWKFGAQPASIQYITRPKLNKEGKVKFTEITRFAHVGVMLGYNYQNSVNNQLERENELRTFMAQQLWRGKGKRITSVLSTHVEKGTFYLTYKKQQTLKSVHVDLALNVVSNSIMNRYFPVSNYSNQGTAKPVYHREISIDNVRRLKVKGKSFLIEG